jgi:hypothetical protein
MLKLIKFFLVPMLAILLCVVVFEDVSLASLTGGADPKSLCPQDMRISPAMNDEEIRLLTSLCDRLSETDDTAGADFALLLATALIILS